MGDVDLVSCFRESWAAVGTWNWGTWNWSFPSGLGSWCPIALTLPPWGPSEPHPGLLVLVAVLGVAHCLLAYYFGLRRERPWYAQIAVVLAFLVLGFLFLPIWCVVGAALRRREFEMSWSEALWEQLFPADDEEDDSDEEFMVFDSQGMPLGHGATRGAVASGRALALEVLEQAVKEQASDLLIHPASATQYNVRVRVHGSLRTMRSLDPEEGRAVVNCIKAVSGMDIAERRRPQDGSFTARKDYHDIRFRVATAGVMQGEKLAMRILDPSTCKISLDTIGLSSEDAKLLQQAAAAQAGLILVCGPTGSGKSTTTQAMLRSIDGVERNLITIEEPIEYVLPHASQIEVNRKAGITFAEVLRNVLRQDPDVISIGEIRDSETARIALQAAQTGHLVFATLHSGSNAAAMHRLLDLGCEPQLVADTLRLIISQRLVRRLCDHCKSQESFSDAQKADLWKKMVDPERLFGPRGCEHCSQNGYSGRTAVFDILSPDAEQRRRIVDGRFEVDPGVPSQTTAQGMSPIHVRATQLAMVGWTSWDDVQKVASSE